jgi:hypothetical protein
MSIADGRQTFRWPDSSAGNGFTNRRTALPAGVSGISLLACDVALAVAIGVLALGFVLPQVCTVIQIILIAAFILHGSAAWLPAMVTLLCTPTDFKAGGMELQYEKFEGVVVYILGFPMTASYAIVAAALARGLWEWAFMPRFLVRQLNRLWLIPVAIGAAICVYSGILAFLDRTPSWSASARPTLLLVSLWYAISLTRDWPLVRDVMMRRMGPLCTAIVASGFFAPVAGIFTCFYLSLAVAWATLASFSGAFRSQPWLRSSAIVAFVICWAVPIGGLRISAAVAEAAFHKMGNSWLPLHFVAVVAIATGLALVHGRVLKFGSDRLALVVATLGFVAYLALPFVVASFSSNREFETEGNVGSAAGRFTFKFLVERPAIWRGSIEVISQPPYVIVPPHRVGSMITAGGNRVQFGYSAHNLVLEILRSQGFLSGSVSLLILYLCFLACTRCYMTVSDPAATVAAITFVAGGLVNGVAVGHLLESGTGFMLYSCAGIAMGALGYRDYLAASRRSRPAPPEAPQQLPHAWSGTAARGRLALP